jgi:hypothetical protein
MLGLSISTEGDIDDNLDDEGVGETDAETLWRPYINKTPCH